MRIGISIAAIFLFACSASSNSKSSETDETDNRVFEVNGKTPDCRTRLVGEEAYGTLETVAAEHLDKDQKIVLRATPIADYQCVTMAVDQLNDLGFEVTIDERSWKNLASVALGRKKLEADIAGESGHPEARPFDRERDAKADLESALDKAAKSGNDVVVVMGANWCHDSRALSGWFASPRFSRMLAGKYEIVYIDVGYKDRNIDIAQSFGIETIKGTPTVLIVSPEAQLLNSKTAPTWRNAASREEEKIFQYFDAFKTED